MLNIFLPTELSDQHRVACASKRPKISLEYGEYTAASASRLLLQKDVIKYKISLEPIEAADRSITSQITFGSLAVLLSVISAGKCFDSKSRADICGSLLMPPHSQQMIKPEHTSTCS